MQKPILAAAALAASLVAGSASAAELLIISLLPGTSQWYVDGKLVATVDPDAYSAVQVASGPAKIQVMDENADGETRAVTLDPAQLASWNGRTFWCVGGKLNESDKPKIVVMPQPNCQKFASTTLK